MKFSRRVWVGWVIPATVGVMVGLVVRVLRTEVEIASRSSAAAPTSPARGASPSPEFASRRASGEAEEEKAAEAPELPALHEVLAEITDIEERIGVLDPAFLCTEGDCQGWFEPDKETLRQWAACAQLPVDLPSALFRGGGNWFSDEALDSIEITEDEREALDSVADEFGSEVHRRVLDLHAEIVATGETEDRPTHSLIADLRAMQAVYDPDGLDRRLVALERAGEPPPEELGSQEMIPFYRELLRIGDDLEERVGAVIGNERAHALRRHGNGWGARLGNPPMCR